MKCSDVIPILEGMAENPEHAIGVDQVHALYFAVAVIRALPETLTRLIDAVCGLVHPGPLHEG